MDSANSSEFGSEDEDAEFALYAKLYFEPNQELANVDAVDGHLKGDVSDGIISNSSSHQGILVNKTPNNLDVPPKTEPEVRAVKDNSYTEANCKSSRTSEYVPIPLQTLRNTNEVKDKSIEARPSVRRERQSSVCSIGSICGSVALDDLYCNMMDTVDEEDESLVNRLTNSAAPESVGINSVKRMKPIKKKRTRSLKSSDEDSRCKTLEILTSKKRRRGKKQKIVPTHVYFDTSDDSDSCKQKKVRKKKDENIVCIDISDSSDTCILPQSLQIKPKINGIGKKKSTCKIHNAFTNDISESTVFKQPRVVVKTGTDDCEKECLIKAKPSVTIPSDIDSIPSDSDSDDIHEMPLRTKLTMNFNFPSQVNKYGLDTNMNFELKNSFRKQETSKNTFDYTRRQPLSKKHPSCKNWTPEMTSFYDSDVYDDFSVEKVHSHQSSFKSDWNINLLDYRGVICSRNRYYSQQRCTRCRQFGHLVEKCPRVPHCFICSDTSHTRRNECPSNCCFRCGGPPHFFCYATASALRCPLCGNAGHREDACPDLWRRYHITTSGSVPVIPTSPVNLQTNNRRYCCMCGRRGHFGHECPLKYTIKSQYCIQGQMVINYNQPVENVTGESIINLEEAEASENVTKLTIDSSETGSIIGRGGTIIKSIQQQTGASLKVVEENNSCYLQICGDLEAQALCRTAIEGILGRRVNSANSKSCGLLRIMSKNRNKQSIIRIIRNRIQYYCRLRRKLVALPSVVDVLKKGQRLQLKATSPSPEFLQQLEKSLQFASEMLVGHLKCGEGKSIFSYINDLLYKVSKFNRREKVPLFILEEIAHTFEKVDKPSIGKLDEILDLAETHLQTKDQRLNGSKNNTDNGMDIIEIESSSNESGKETDCQNLKGIFRNVKKREKVLEGKQSNFNETPGFSGDYVKRKVLSSKRKVDLRRKKKRKQQKEESGIRETEGFPKSKKKNKVMSSERKGDLQSKNKCKRGKASDFKDTEGFPKGKRRNKVLSSKRKLQHQYRKLRKLKNANHEKDGIPSSVKLRKLKKKITNHEKDGVPSSKSNLFKKKKKKNHQVSKI